MNKNSPLHSSTWLTTNIKSTITQCFNSGSSNEVHELYIFILFFLISSVSPLPEGLDSTPTKFLASPLYARRISLLSPLFIVLYRTIHWHLFISWAEEGYRNIESRRVCPFKEAHIRPLILLFSFRFFPCPSLLNWIILKTPKHNNSSVDVRFPEWTWRSWFDTRLS